MIPASAARAQVLLFDYVGLDYEDPDPDTTQFGEAGSGYVGLGEVPNLFAPLVPDTANNVYTYHFSGLSLISRTLIGTFLILEYSSGTLDIWEDSKTTGTTPTFGVNPPNGTAPSTFTDGTLFLRGSVDNLKIVINATTGSGNYDAEFEAIGGSQLGNIPLGQREGWTFAGVTRNSLDVPSGYEHQVDGQVFVGEPTRTVLASWGTIKARYR
jgi:hypothetical protein